MPIHQNVTFLQRLLQDYSVQRCAARKGNIHLSVGERSAPHIAALEKLDRCISGKFAL
jgi:hypothetical protein